MGAPFTSAKKGALKKKTPPYGWLRMVEDESPQEVQAGAYQRLGVAVGATRLPKLLDLGERVRLTRKPPLGLRLCVLDGALGHVDPRQRATRDWLAADNQEPLSTSHLAISYL